MPAVCVWYVHMHNACFYSCCGNLDPCLSKQELFVTEYRLMLADKLVNNLTYDTDRDVQNLELLKLRFGESSMHQCEIMVRNMKHEHHINWSTSFYSTEGLLAACYSHAHPLSDDVSCLNARGQVPSVSIQRYTHQQSHEK